MMVRCEENIVNTDVFLKSQFFNFFDILGSSGRLGTSFGRLFGCLGPHFRGPAGCWEYTAILLPWLAGWGDPKIQGIRKFEGKLVIRGVGNNLTTD